MPPDWRCRGRFRSDPAAALPMLADIKHPITDLSTWLQAFNTFAPARLHAGVNVEQIWQPDDDPHYILVNLEIRI